MTIAAGKTVEMPIKSLKYGFRNAEKMAYWTEPGEYTLSASLKTGHFAGAARRQGNRKATLAT